MAKDEEPEPEESPAPKETEEAPASGVLPILAAQTATFHAAVEQLRSRSDLTWKAIAGLDSGAIGAIGLAKYSDVFPFDASCWWLVPLIGGFAAMVAGIVILVLRFLKPQEPLVVRSDDRLITGVSPGERRLIAEVYDDAAELNDVDNLLALEARAHRFRRIAKTLPADRRSELERKFAETFAFVQATFARASHAVVRDRASQAVKGLPSILAFVLFFGGFASATLATDAIDASRDTAELKACAEAAQAGVVITELPDDCPELDPAFIQPPPPG